MAVYECQRCLAAPVQIGDRKTLGIEGAPVSIKNILAVPVLRHSDV